MNRWLLAYVGAVVLAGVTIVVQSVWCLSRSDWATWVQAIGSIVAIAVSGVLVAWQVQATRNLAEREAARRDNALLAAAHALGVHAWEVVGHMLTQIRDEPTARRFFMFAWDPEAITSIERMLETFPLHQLPNGKFVKDAARLRQIIRSARGLLVGLAESIDDPDSNLDWPEIASYSEEYGLALRRLTDALRV